MHLHIYIFDILAIKIELYNISMCSLQQNSLFVFQFNFLKVVWFQDLTNEIKKHRSA